jgi:DNA-binding SARP family transcriptional activator
MSYDVRVLGELTVVRDGVVVPLARGARELVLALAILGPAPVLLDRIVDMMVGRDVVGPAMLRARRATVRALARLRAACPGLVDLAGGCYELAARVDLARYRVAEDACSGRGGDAVWRAALDAYGGDLAGDQAPGWAAKARAKLRGSYLHAVAELADRRRADGDHADAASLARTLTALEPTNASYVSLLMAALADLGDVAGIEAAAQLHHDYRRAMGQDGLDPAVDAERRRQLARVAADPAAAVA